MIEVFRSLRFIACTGVLSVGSQCLAGGPGTPGLPLQEPPAAAQQTAPASGDSKFEILNDPKLPDTYPRANYEMRFQGSRTGTPPFHWRLEKGALPPGIKLDDDGRLHGQPERSGEFQFTVAVRDAGAPELVARKEFELGVIEAFHLNWKNEARVSGSRIEGSAEITNTTADAVDLTFIVLAVPSNGRAVAIGYQHFVLPSGTIAKELPFGETLPRGGYVVHVDAVGEVPARNVIYRQRLQTRTALQVAVGP
jgi:hypothetical protein